MVWRIWLQERMNIMHERLTDIVGQKEARALFAHILEDNTGEDLHGDHTSGVEQSI